MKIAVVGIGVAGGYLVSRLKKDHEVVGYERMTEENHDSICAWGTSANEMRDLCAKSDINFDDFIIHHGKDMHIDMNSGEKFDIGLKGLVTFDKIGLIKKMSEGVKIHYGVAPKLEELEKEFDIIVDCTGFYRGYLPKIKEDFFLPTYQYKIQYDGKIPIDDFFVKPFAKMTGYFWYFPLNDNMAHIGAGDYKKNHIVETDKFFKQYGGKITKTVGRPIRLATPNLCEPFYHGKVIGVGESIGTVYPLLGEGIIPSMICADIFIKNINDWPKYREDVLNYFAIYGKVFNFVRAKMHGNLSIIKSLADLIAIFRYMKKNERRFGMAIHMRDLMKVAKA
ncbi:MAG: NAD(P)/FAD-dependent oxidoreductase [Thaumarchaeota archaeon]|nr:NAD(P)/FAD-dependent oxidoreductase [Nitrososphaerota archaeon]NDB89377.1 NAD(P)/FAD-dependent oxidoreductase [Nitrososphaerota archaeon]NDF26053.1 NAD(P)/FAD-dependent oxidoreductase [Nitrosopumilaceae archaeon]